MSDCFLWVESKRRLNENELETDQHQEDDELLQREVDLTGPGVRGVWSSIHGIRESLSETSGVFDALTALC